MNKQIRQLGAALVVLFLVLFVQLNNVQILQAAKLNNNPSNNRNAVRDFSAPRGNIQTADGQVIATSVPSNDQYKQLRQYPQGPLYSQLTGFFSFNYGSEGLEKIYNKDLTGKTYALKNVGDLLTDRVHTNNVTITVDSKLQELAQSQLRGRRGSVVVLNPKTGAVLAMYSNPTYDPNPLSSHDFASVTSTYNSLIHAPENPMLPRSYRETFAPGSTFKVITSSAVYDHKPELATKSYPSVSAIALPDTNKTLGNFNREVCGGTLPELLKVSCNTGFGQIGLDLGGDNLSAEAQAFGFNQVPPLDLPAVAKSRFPSPETFIRNRPGIAYSAIGQQDVSATPLQMALMASGIANDGVIMKPHLLKEVRDNHGDVVRTDQPQPWIRATSQDTANKVRDLMIGVAQAGTATGAQIPGVQVAAKTGTAQTGNGTVHTWLVSFAPADNPQVAVAVILENQPATDDATGGVIAAPVAKAMMKAALGIS